MNKDFSLVNKLLVKALEIWPDFFETNKPYSKGKQSLYFLTQDCYGNTAATVLGKGMEGKELADAVFFTTEKLTRTLLGDPRNATSFPTQNYVEKKYGGCIVSAIARVSGSGLSPKLEHLFGIRVLKECGLLGDIEYQNIQAEYEEYKDIGR